MKQEEEPWGYASQDDTFPQKRQIRAVRDRKLEDSDWNAQNYDEKDMALQSAQSEIAIGNELINERIRQLDEEDQNLEAELASLKGEIEQLCAEHDELPAPKSIAHIAEEVAKDYLNEINLTAKQAGALIVKAITKKALRANVALMLAEVGGRLVMKLRERGKLIRQREEVSRKSIEDGNKMLATGEQRIDLAKERSAQFGREFVRRHEQRQQEYDDMIRNAGEESRRQWDSINRSADEVESGREDDINDLINGFDNI